MEIKYSTIISGIPNHMNKENKTRKFFGKMFKRKEKKTSLYSQYRKNSIDT